MARNRKSQSVAVRFEPAIKAFLLCLFIGGAGVGYVNQKNQVHLLGEKMRKLEILCDKQNLHRQVLLRKLTALNSSNEIEAQVKRMNLDLSPVPPDRIVRVFDVPSDSGNRDERLLAERTMQSSIHR